MGVVSVAARVGGILSPFVSMMDQVAPALQFSVLGTLMVVSGLSALLLPETKGKSLPETIQDVEDTEDTRPLLGDTTTEHTPLNEEVMADSSEEEIIYGDKEVLLRSGR